MAPQLQVSPPRGKAWEGGASEERQRVQQQGARELQGRQQLVQLQLGG